MRFIELRLKKQPALAGRISDVRRAQVCILCVRDEVTNELAPDGSRAIPKGGHLCLINEVVVGCLVHRLNKADTGHLCALDDCEIEMNAHIASIKERCIFEAGVNRPLAAPTWKLP